MKIIVFGARGDVGRRIVEEALGRGHQVTAVVRNAAQSHAVPAGAGVCEANAADPDRAAELMAGHDLAISALRPPEGHEQSLPGLTASVLTAAARSGVRVLIVGGAASLRLPDGGGETVLTAPGFLPEDVVPIARASQAQYELCLAETAADWTYLSPPAMLLPGCRSGRYRIGADTLLTDAKGESYVSMEDLAVALLDEAESAHHRRARFTVAAAKSLSGAKELDGAAA